MALIVSDNSPLSLLIQINQIAVLPELFDQVIIPSEVAAEMNHVKAPERVRSFIARPPDWIKILNATNPLHFEKLDSGESAAISLAVQLRAILLIDEREGRRIAAEHGIIVIGAIGILETAALRGLIADLAIVHDQIRKQRFHVAESVLEMSLKRYRERNP